MRLTAVLLICCPSISLAQEAPPTPAQALQRLKDGNERFAADRPARKDIGNARRQELAKGQHPFAVILGCADSRVPPELVFDQGLGDLFVIRVAGNITDPSLIGSIEFAVSVPRVPLIVVLGHEECGAVKAALDEPRPTGNLGELIRKIHVGKRAREEGAKDLPAAIRANAVYQASQLTRQSPVIKEFVDRERVRIVVGIYSLSTGKVEWQKPAEKGRE
jgi:carbonic anhydrase